MLGLPCKPANIVLDTDTKNEIDDQFAIVYALLSSNDIKVEAINAAPFLNQRRGYTDSASGMEASYQEILTLLDKMGLKGKVPVFKGSKTVLKSPDEPVNSDAAKNLVQLAMKKREGPLYVPTIGAVTNVVSAILMAPEIMERIVVIWLGAHPPSWDWQLGAQIGCPNHFKAEQGYGVGGWEFNLSNDPLGAMALFDSGVPLVWVPCKNVAEHLRTVPAEIEQYVRGQGSIGNYLADIFKGWGIGEARSKVLWDISAIAYLVNPEWVPTILSLTPTFDADKLTKLVSKNPFGRIGPRRHFCRIALHVKRDPVFLDLFQKLEKFAKGEISLKT